MKFTLKGLNIIKQRQQLLNSLHVKAVHEVDTTAKQGDIKENWGHTAALDDLNKIKSELLYLNQLLASHYTVVTADQILDKKRVEFGATIVLGYDIQENSQLLSKTIQYTIVNEYELHYISNGIAENGQLAQMVLGKYSGDIVHMNNKEFMLKEVFYED